MSDQKNATLRILGAAEAAGIAMRFHRTGPETQMLGKTPNHVVGYDVTLTRTVDGQERTVSLHCQAGVSEAEEIDKGPSGAMSTYAGPALLEYQVLWGMLEQAKMHFEKPTGEWPEDAQQLHAFLGEELLDRWVRNIVSE